MMLREVRVALKMKLEKLKLLQKHTEKLESLQLEQLTAWGNIK
jgi:hypothetical protein